MSFNPGSATLSGSADVALSNPQNQQVLAYQTSTAKWINGAPTDATVSVKGAVQLAGDLAGTAEAPTVPGLATKANLSHTHTAATTAAAGFLSAADKIKLDGVSTSANNYSHPTGDGNLHIPATSTTNNGRVLKAGATAGSVSWSTLTATDVGAAATSHTHAAADISSGTIATARLGSGTANSTTYLRGDGTWNTPNAGATGYTIVNRTTGFTAADRNFVICDASAGGFTINLPTATAGSEIRILKTDASANAIVVMGNGNPTLAGSISYSVNSRWMSQDFAADGTNWYCV